MSQINNLVFNHVWSQGYLNSPVLTQAVTPRLLIAAYTYASTDVILSFSNFVSLNFHVYFSENWKREA